MSIIFHRDSEKHLLQNQAPSIARKKSGHTFPRQPVISLADVGRLRVANLLAILNISHSTLYAGLKVGRYPPPDGRDGNLPYWMTTTILHFLNQTKDVDRGE
jgi:hypothetical protein